MKSKNTILILVLLTISVGVLILPISNFFLSRETITVTAGVPEFKYVSTIMQNKCVDCHTPGMMSKPIYANFPFASQLIDDDMAAAQKQITFTREHLSGVKPFSKLEAARISTVVENNEMPILPYKLLHWNAGLSPEDRYAVAEWISAQFNSAGSSSAKPVPAPEN